MSLTLHLEGQTRHFTVLDRLTIKLYKNKMDSKFIKSHQYFYKDLMLCWLKLILISDQELSLFLNKSRFLQVY